MIPNPFTLHSETRIEPSDLTCSTNEMCPYIGSAPASPYTPEPNIPKIKAIPEKVKPVEGKTPTPSMESPITAEPTPSSNEEFQTLKEEWISPFKQLRINSIERQLEGYKDPQAMYKAQGSNAFTRAYRKTMTRDDKLRANIERRDRLTERLKQLRGE